MKPRPLFYCPAAGVRCTAQCTMRGQCERDPDAVMELVERLDRETIEALLALHRKKVVAG